MASSSGVAKMEKYEIEKFNGKNYFFHWRMQNEELVGCKIATQGFVGKGENAKWDEGWGLGCLRCRSTCINIVCNYRDTIFLVNEE